jgi:hypothetical protein
MQKNILVSTAYLPSVFYLKQILLHDTVLIEKHENFIKQTYRNRCDIVSANGMMALSIPLIKQNNKELISEKKISYAENWQQQHWRSLVSAYKSSPYFEFFEHEFKSFYETQFEFLFDYNLQLLETILKILRVKKTIQFTDTYELTPTEEVSDYRALCELKQTNVKIESKPYYQVFADKNGFKENVSCIDALFNIGLDVKHL